MERELINHIQWECQQFLNRVTMLMDSGQWEALAACYTEDGVLFRPSDPDNGVEGRAAILASFQARPPRTSCHLLANCVFEVKAADRVEANSRVWLVAGDAAPTYPVKADSKLLIGSFRDELMLVDGEWFIRRREGGIELAYNYQ